MSLYRNYRPKDFANLVGQEHVRITLLNAVKTGNLAHAYLFTGPRGTGKTSTARLLAKALNCPQIKEKEQCDGCELCLETDQGKLIDIIEIDAASNRGIDGMRDLREKIHCAPTGAPHKIYIIDEVHMLTKEAFNALLKTLEEPPKHVYFILATTEIHKVPETIISRCQRFDFKRIDENNLLGRLEFVAQQEGIQADPDALKILARQARGGLRDALGLLEQLTIDRKLTTEHVRKMLGISDYAALEDLSKLLKEGNSREAISKIQSLYNEGFDLIQFNKDFLEFLRQGMIQAVQNENKASIQWHLAAVNHFQEAYEKQKYAVIAELPLEVAVVKTCIETMAGGQEDDVSSEKKKPEVTSQLINVHKAQREQSKTPVITSTPRIIANQRETVHSTPIQTPEPTISENTEKTAETEVVIEVNFSLEQLNQMWSEICAKVTSPVVRSNLKASRPQQLQGNKLTLVFGNNFHKDKLFNAQAIAEAEQAILHTTGVRFALEGKVDPTFKFTDLQNSSFNTEKFQVTQSSSQENIQPASNKLIDEALQIFGGELVE